MLMYLRRRARSMASRQKRHLLIVDSQVVAGVMAKGRSSSRRLNRVCRRMLALEVATDNYPLVVWTISKWNFSDFASRKFSPRDA